MGLILLGLGLFLPRLAIIILVIAGDYIGRAYETTIWPFIGFLALPATTLAYAYAINTNGSLSGWYFWVVAIGLLIDLGSGGSASKTSRSSRR